MRLQKSDFIYLKMDMSMNLSYCNHVFLSLLEKPEDELLGLAYNEVWAPSIPISYEKFARKNFAEKNFRHSFCPYDLGNGQQEWIFFNFCKRFSSTEEWIGYEYVGYKSSQMAVDFFTPIYKAMQDLESQQSGEQGVLAASQYLDNYIENMDCEYEKYLCLLQNAR